VLAIQTISLFLSFFIVYLKHKYSSKKILKPKVKVSKIDPYIKSSVLDYFTGDLVLMSILGLALFGLIIIGLSPNFQFFHEFKNIQPITIGIIIVLTFGFSGVIGSISNINWMFFSIVCPKSFLYFVKKTFLILISCFLLLLIALGFIKSLFGLVYLLRYLYFMFVIMLFSIFTAFSHRNIIGTTIKMIVFVIFSAFITTLHFGFLLLLIVPLFIAGFIAKLDYKDRYYL
jgi:hypothetical protein